MLLSFLAFACGAKGEDVPEKACVVSPRSPVLDPGSSIRRCSPLSLSTAWLLALYVSICAGRKLGGPVRLALNGSRNVLIAAAHRISVAQCDSSDKYKDWKLDTYVD